VASAAAFAFFGPAFLAWPIFARKPDPGWPPSRGAQGSTPAGSAAKKPVARKRRAGSNTRKNDVRSH
jgi:hypothetical protein